MIKKNDPKVIALTKGMHEMVDKNVKRAGRVKEDILKEGCLLSLICLDQDLGPNKAASLMDERYAYDLSADEIISMFRGLHMANPRERKELLRWAEEIADLFAEAAEGKRDSFDRFEKQRREPFMAGVKRNPVQYRLAAIMIYEKYSILDPEKDLERVLQLGNTLGKYFFYDIIDQMCDAVGYTRPKENMNKVQTKDVAKRLTYEEALKRVAALESTLERTEYMLQDLQEEFNEQLEASRVKELTDFFAKLNSEKYGCILDELLIVRKGVDELRKNNFELPIEINGLLIMVKKLIQFVRDSRIEPVMRVNSVREVNVSDVEFCVYDGSPFTSADEKKKVKVVSSGWVYKEKDVQISRPKVKEVN